MSEHTMHVEILDGHVYLSVRCPHDPADETRPCWPQFGDGDERPLPAPQECVYISWCDNCMADEWHTGSVVFECDATFDWPGDEPTVTLTNPRALSGESMGEKT